MQTEKQNRQILIEILAFVGGLLVLGLVMQDLLLGKTIFAHDIFHWYYPLFSFFVENVWSGNYPWWNPFSHGGEPFYTHIVALKLLDPIRLSVIFIGRFFTDNLILLFNWHYFLEIVLLCVNLYLFLRSYAANLFVRISLVPVLLFSGVFLSSFRSNAILDSFLWIPLIAYFLIRVFFKKDTRTLCFVLPAGIIGTHFQAYRFVGIFMFLLFFVAALALFYRQELKEFIGKRSNLYKLVLSGVIVAVMILPDLIIYLDQHKFVLPVRMSQKIGEIQNINAKQVEASRLTYAAVEKNGTFAKIWDFLHMTIPYGKFHYEWFENPDWGSTSEANFYIGMLPWMIFIIGAIVSTHYLKRLFLFLLATFTLFILGPSGGLHRLLFYVYPPAQFDRHVFAYFLFAQFAVLFFYVQGLNFICINWRRARLFTDQLNSLSRVLAIVAFTTAIIVCVNIMLRLRPPALFTYHCVFIAVIVATGYLLRRYLGQIGLFLSIVVSMLALMFSFNTVLRWSIPHFILFLIVPIILYYYIARYVQYSKTPKVALGLIALTYLFTLNADLLCNLYNSQFVYIGQPEPSVLCHINTRAVPPSFPSQRYLAATQCYSSTEQSVRYLDLLDRKPYLFTIPRYFPKRDPAPVTFEDVRKIRKWDTFLFLRNYFLLLYSETSSSNIKEIFALDQPLIQFKTGIFAVDDITSGLDLLKDPQLSTVLRENVLLDKKNIQLMGSSSNLPVGFSLSDFDKNLLHFESKIKKNAKTLTQKGPQNFQYTVSQQGYSQYVFNVTSPQEGLLYWADGYDSAWRARVNGKDIPVLQANLNFKAVVIPKGQSKVEFYFKKDSFKFAVIAFYSALAFAFLLALVSWTGGWIKSWRPWSAKRV